jgi:hypothetical protein
MQTVPRPSSVEISSPLTRLTIPWRRPSLSGKYTRLYDHFADRSFFKTRPKVYLCSCVQQFSFARTPQLPPPPPPIWAHIRGRYLVSQVWRHLPVTPWTRFSCKVQHCFQCCGWIHDIFVWIRIRGSMPLTLTSGSGCGSGSYYYYFNQWSSRCQQDTN